LRELYLKSVHELNKFRERKGKLKTEIDPEKLKAVRYPDEVEFTNEKVIEILKRRVSEIQNVIDDHLEFLHGPDCFRFFNIVSV